MSEVPLYTEGLRALQVSDAIEEARQRALKTTTGRELMASRTDRMTRIPSGVASPLTTKHAACLST